MSPLTCKTGLAIQAATITYPLALLLAGCMTSGQDANCTTKTDCPEGYVCRFGLCRFPTAETPDAGGQPDSGKSTDGGCAASGTCVLGNACRSKADCASQFCSGGVCCNEQCGGACSTCTLAGSAGQCKAKPKGSACDAYVCDGLSQECPSSCLTIIDCSTANTCCTADRNASLGNCIGKGFANKCFPLPVCKTVADTFDAPQIDDAVWFEQKSHPGGSARLGGGKLAVTLGQPLGTKDVSTQLSLRQNVSLSNSSCSVEVGDVSSLYTDGGVSESGFFMLSHDFTGSLVFAAQPDSTLSAYEYISGKPEVRIVSKPIAASDRRFLRVRDEGGTVIFEYSKDGKTFIPHTSLIPTLRTSDLFVSLIVNKEQIQRDGGYSVLFDNFNLLP
jgi:hypothetical protein